MTQVGLEHYLVSSFGRVSNLDNRRRLKPNRESNPVTVNLWNAATGRTDVHRISNLVADAGFQVDWHLLQDEAAWSGWLKRAEGKARRAGEHLNATHS